MSAAVLVILTAAVAAPPPEEVRAKAVAHLRRAYQERVERLDREAVKLEDDANDPKGTAASRQANRTRLKAVRAERAALVADPLGPKNVPAIAPAIGPADMSAEARAGMVGTPGAIPGQPVRVVRVTADGPVVEVRYTAVFTGFSTSRATGVRASSAQMPRVYHAVLTGLPPAVKVPPAGGTLKAPGVWVVTAAESANGRHTLTLAPLAVNSAELTDEKMPKAKQP